MIINYFCFHLQWPLWPCLSPTVGDLSDWSVKQQSQFNTIAQVCAVEFAMETISYLIILKTSKKYYVSCDSYFQLLNQMLQICKIISKALSSVSQFQPSLVLWLMRQRDPQTTAPGKGEDREMGPEKEKQQQQAKKTNILKIISECKITQYNII